MPGQKVGKVDCSNWRRAGKGLSLGFPAEFLEGLFKVPQALLVSLRFRGTRAELIDRGDMLQGIVSGEFGDGFFRDRRSWGRWGPLRKVLLSARLKEEE